MSIATLTARRPFVIGKLDHRGVAVLLLLGPCLLYMIAFAIYPLIYSLKLSLTDLRAADAAGHWIGLRNYGDLRAGLVVPASAALEPAVLPVRG